MVNLDSLDNANFKLLLRSIAFVIFCETFDTVLVLLVVILKNSDPTAFVEEIL